MIPDGFLWLPMASPPPTARRTFSGGHLDSYGSLWIPMASSPPPLRAATALLSVAAWIPMAPYGFLWLLFPQLGLERPQVPKTAHKS